MIRVTPKSVRVRLTLWHIAVMLAVLGVYAAAVYTFVRNNSSRLLDERLHDDFDWASDMLAQRPEAPSAAYFETAGSPAAWRPTWRLEGRIRHKTKEERNDARGQTAQSGGAAKGEDRLGT